MNKKRIIMNREKTRNMIIDISNAKGTLGLKNLEVETTVSIVMY